MIRTRFAPSPTGFLHIGGVRTALFNWAYTRKNNGTFILRIEDTDLERSTPESVQTILDSLAWIGIDYDEGPFYQTQRFERYHAAIQQLLASGQAYYCYCSKEELDTIRAQQEKVGEKPRYPHIWRPEVGKVLPPIPDGVLPVVRFKTPLTGQVYWHDAVKGEITFNNEELDDLIIARPDGSPTYNFCVVVDDIDMQISHVIRGDDHVNNTPRQIHLFHALQAPLPTFAHLPMILNEEGQKLSKRHDAIGVSDYDTMGVLPETLLNYLARLGWGHENDEIFDMPQLAQWFTLEKVSSAPSRLNQDKLLWLNAHYIKQADNARLAKLIEPRLPNGVSIQSSPNILAVIELLKTRVQDLNSLAHQVSYFYSKLPAPIEEIEKYLTPTNQANIAKLLPELINLPLWEASALESVIKNFCQTENIKMANVGLPLRLMLCGTTKTPALGETLAVLGKENVITRLNMTLNI